MKTPTQKPALVRTYRQNRALHLWLRMIAEELNSGGYNVNVVMKQRMEIDWTPELVKELLWRPTQKIILGKKSTTSLKKTEDIDKIYDHLNRHLGEKFGVYVGWPHFESEEAYIKATSL